MSHDFSIRAWKGSGLTVHREEAVVEFTAPREAGETTYACTPHGEMMRGTICCRMSLRLATALSAPGYQEPLRSAAVCDDRGALRSDHAPALGTGRIAGGRLVWLRCQRPRPAHARWIWPAARVTSRSRWPRAERRFRDSISPFGCCSWRGRKAALRALSRETCWHCPSATVSSTSSLPVTA